MPKSATAAKPVRKNRPIRPVKLANLTSAVQAAAAYSAYHGEYKATPSKSDWNKLIKQITLSAKYLTCPYQVIPTLLPVWTKSYREAQKGHVPAKPIVIPKKAKAAPKAKPSGKPAMPAGVAAMLAEAIKDGVDAYIASLTAK